MLKLMNLICMLKNIQNDLKNVVICLQTLIKAVICLKLLGILIVNWMGLARTSDPTKLGPLSVHQKHFFY